MQLTIGANLRLIDSANRQLGDVDVERIEADLVVGHFVPKPAFREHEEVFYQFEEAVNAQSLALVDQLDAKIAGLGLQVASQGNGIPVQADDVQIWSDGGISFRIRAGVAAVQKNFGE